MNNDNYNAEQATRFPRVPSPSPSPSTSAPITIPSPAVDHQSPADYLNGAGQQSAAKVFTSPPPGFCGPPQNSPKRSSIPPSAAQLVHPGETIFNLGGGMTFSSSSGVTEEDIKSSTEKRNLPSGPFLASGLASSTGSTASPSSSSSPEGSTTSSSSSLGTIQKEAVRLLEQETPTSTMSTASTMSSASTISQMSTTSTMSPMSASSLPPFSQLGDFNLQHSGVNGQFLIHGVGAAQASAYAPSPPMSEEFRKMKQKRLNKARKVERNVKAEHKAEDVEGYEGGKPINDVLQSLGETVVEEKKQKVKRGNKDKKERKRKEKTQVDEVEGDEEDREIEEDTKLTEKEATKTNEKKTTGKKGQKQSSEGHKVETVNQTVNQTVEEERSLLLNNEDLAASSDSLNFVPVTSKKKGKKNKEEQEKMKDYSKKSKEDTGRPPPQYLGGGRDGRPPPIPPGGGGRDIKPLPSATSGSSRVTENRRTSNYSLRSREVQISGEVERQAADPVSPTNINPPSSNSLEDFPALDISQDFPALPTARQTDKPHIHSAWARKPSAGSSSGGGASAAPKKAVINTEPTTAVDPELQQQQLDCDNSSVTRDGPAPTPAPASAPAHKSGVGDAATTVKTDAEAFNTSQATGAGQPAQTRANNYQTKRPPPTTPGHYNSSPNNERASNCDKLVVSDSILPKSGENTQKDKTAENSASVHVADVSEATPAPNYPSYSSSQNPLLCDDFVSNDGGDDSTERDLAVNDGSCMDAEQDIVEANAMEADSLKTPQGENSAKDIDFRSSSSNSDNNSAGNYGGSATPQRRHDSQSQQQSGDKFEFDTRSNFDSLVSLPSEQNFGEISFGFEVNMQLLDFSQMSQDGDQPEDSEGSPKTEGEVEKKKKIEGEVQGEVQGEAQLPVQGDTQQQESRDQSDEQEAAAGNIASMDKAILSFRSSQNMLVGDGYEFGYIPPPFASNYLPNMPQVNGSPESRQDEPKEVVSPESGICSPLSWQGEGEEGGHTVTSPPLQPGSYPRRTGENRDIMSQLNKSLKHLRRSSRSPSPHNSVRSGSVESYTTPRANMSFPRSEDSGLNTTSRSLDTTTRSLDTPSRSLDESVTNPNYGEIVSFLKNNWNESSKDKQAKVYDGKKERR